MGKRYCKNKHFYCKGRVSKSANIVINIGISASIVIGNVKVCALL